MPFSAEYKIDIRLTVDADEDLCLTRAIYEKLYRDDKLFTMSDIVKLYNEEPNMFRINSHLKQNYVSNRARVL